MSQVTTPNENRGAAGWAGELLLAAAVSIGLLAIAVALLEGPALDSFLYAVF